MLTVINIEPASIPDAMKFLVNKSFLPSQTITYHSLEDAGPDPLGAALFQIPGIQSVTYKDDMVRITKTKDASWDTIIPAAENTISTTPPVLENISSTGSDPSFSDSGFGNGPSLTSGGADSMSTAVGGELGIKIQKVLDEIINPSVATHGGMVTLLDVKGPNVYVQFGGGCHGCGLVDATLKQGVEATLREEVSPDLVLIDTTDHAGGTNPYYAPR